MVPDGTTWLIAVFLKGGFPSMRQTHEENIMENIEKSVSLLTRPTTLSTSQSFNDEVDRVEPFTCSEEDLGQLIEAAPGEFAHGYLCAIFDFRQQIAAVTGRRF